MVNSSRREDGDWFDPGLVTVDDGVELVNNSSQRVTLKGNRVCEVRNVIEVSPEEIMGVRKVFNEFPDSFQYRSLAPRPDDKSYLDDIQVDPDGEGEVPAGTTTSTLWSGHSPTRRLTSQSTWTR